MAQWDKFFEQVPKIISEAAQSALGIVALSILALSVLGFIFFSDSTDLVKVPIFLVLVLSFGLFGFAAIRQIPEKRNDGLEKMTVRESTKSAIFISYCLQEPDVSLARNWRMCWSEMDIMSLLTQRLIGVRAG